MSNVELTDVATSVSSKQTAQRIKLQGLGKALLSGGAPSARDYAQ
jgi:hypothetical protein